MPATTRSRSRALRAIQDAPPASPPSETIKDPSDNQGPNDNIQDHALSQRSRKVKRPRSTTQKPRKRKPQERTRKQPVLNQEARSQIATILSPPTPSETTLTHFSCRICSCPQGVFDCPVDSCVRCGHDMDDHHNQNHPWEREFCDYACDRQDLVASILAKAQELRVLVIRATPMTGKTMLLRLLGHHIVHQERNLEPVFLEWRPRRKRDNLPYKQYLEQKASTWRERNAQLRPNNPNARTIYLIDEAQGSYEEEEFWGRTLKEHSTRKKPIFVLVCLYGAAALSRKVNPEIESQAQLMDRMHRVELRQTGDGPYMLFKREETSTTVKKWAFENHFKLREGTDEFIHIATDGHPGVVGLMLMYFRNCFENLPQSIRYSKEWSPELCNSIITEQHDQLLDLFSQWGRGLWVPAAEEHARESLDWHEYRSVTFPEVVDAMREVARRPHGYVRTQKDWDAFAFCYKMGYLHIEPGKPGGGKVKYIFASPIHRRLAYRRLCAGPEPGSSRERLSLQQICINAIARFSLSVLQNRSTQPGRGWGIPEAAFQDEMYCCLNYELRNLPILSEYAHTAEGRIDFYMFEKKWGIELLQSGSTADVAEYASRFRPGGKYYDWNILDDYIIINFCSKSTIRKINIKDAEVHPHILQVAIDLEEYVAEVYTHDHELQRTLTLGEGRQRYEEFDPMALHLSALQNQVQEMHREREDAKREKGEMEREKGEMEQKMEEMKREIKRLQAQTGGM